MKNEEIEQKLARLVDLYDQIKALREAQGEEFSIEDEDLLSKPELLEEALKNYMYQFGMSIYRNKKGKKFFKKFIHEEDEIRGFDELDGECFELQEAHAGFLQRLMEYQPENKLLLTTNVADAVSLLYSKDPQMIDIFDELVNEEASHCLEVINEGKLDAEIQHTFEIQNEITTPEITIELDAPSIEITDIEKEIERPEPIVEEEVIKTASNSNEKNRSRAPRAARVDDNLRENYQCGTNNIEKNKRKHTSKQNITRELGKDGRVER